MPDRYIPNVPCWVDTSRADAQPAVDFYGSLFGWEFENVSPPEQPAYFVARLDGHDVAAVGEQPGPAAPAMWNTYVWVESADEAAAKVTAAGGTVTMEPFDVGPAGRMAAFTDPAGASFCVWQAGEHRGAEAVNEAGSWVFSDLNTRDPETSMAFYGEVFGWEADATDNGYAMVRLPGYGDFLESRNPGWQAQLAEYEAPEGFADTVASLVPMSTEPDVPARWGITFSVDDADATARRAVELGGRVVIEPFDAPPVRAAVLADPDGVAFSVSKFTPPTS